jgi:hypothetical protein
MGWSGEPQRVPERAEQHHIVTLVRQLGGFVYVLGTTRRRHDYPGTMQTPGIADLLVFLPVRGTPHLRQVWIEVKASDGRLSPPQRAFRDRCQRAGVDHLSGTLDAVIAFLTAEGYLRAERQHHIATPVTTTRQ